MKKSLLLAFAFLLVCGVPCAQNVKRLSRQAIDSLRNPLLERGEKAPLLFSCVKHDMGAVYETDSSQVLSFPFVNAGKVAVRIIKVTTNCGCTAAGFTGDEIMPGDSGVVTITYNPRHRSGTVYTNAFVYTSLSPERPAARLTVLGTVIDKNEWSHLPVVMGCLRTKRRSVVFEPLKGGTEPQQRIPCVNVGKDSVRLSSSILPSYARLSTEPSVIAPGEEADIIITIVGSVLPRELPGSFNIVLDGIGGPLRDRTIKVTLNR